MIAQVDVAHAVAGLRRQMEIAVDVNEVRWNEVREFVARLERVLVAIKSVGHDHPREAAGLAWEFLTQIRGAADAVSGENELAEFFDEALTETHELAMDAGIGTDERAKNLIDAFVVGSGYGMGEPAIELVKGLELNAAQRIDVATYARDQMKNVSHTCGKELEHLAGHLVDVAAGDHRD